MGEPHGYSCIWDSPEGVQRLKQDDADAWQGLVECYGERLRRDIFTSLLKRGLTEDSLFDIAQDTWLKAVQAIEEFKWQGEDTLYHWLRVISLNLVRKRARRLKQRGGPPIRPGQTRSGLDSSNSSWAEGQALVEAGLVGDNPENQMILNAQTAEIEQALGRIENPLHRELACKAILENKKPHELASEYGMKARTISQIVWRIKRELLPNGEDGGHDGD